MVKPENDATLDYYALLKVTITASTEEIKKQYKKFGTHPHHSGLT
jgi:DnaJ-class molecular chaperone